MNFALYSSPAVFFISTLLSAPIIRFPGPMTPDEILEAAKGDYEDLLLIGWNKNGDMQVYTSSQLYQNQDVLWLVMVFINRLLNGELDDEEE